MFHLPYQFGNISANYVSKIAKVKIADETGAIAGTIPHIDGFFTMVQLGQEKIFDPKNHTYHVVEPYLTADQVDFIMAVKQKLLDEVKSGETIMRIIFESIAGGFKSPSLESEEINALLIEV